MINMAINIFVKEGIQIKNQGRKRKNKAMNHRNSKREKIFRSRPQLCLLHQMITY